MKHFFLLSLALAGLLLSHTAQAANAELAKLERTINAALDVLYAADNSGLSLEQKQSRVREILESQYDLDVIIRRAIGRNWEKMDASEQRRVVDLVKQLTVKSYVKGMEGKSRPEIDLGSVVQISDKRMEIDSRIHLDGKTYHVLYRLGRLPSGWQIYDIVAENISVVSNYRQQISDHFRSADAGQLIERLEELLEKEDIDENIQI